MKTLLSFRRRWGDLESNGHEKFLGHEVLRIERNADDNDEMWKESLQDVKPLLALDFTSCDIVADDYEMGRGFLPPVMIDEKHNFHRYLKSRCDKENAFYGYLSVIDWVWFFCKTVPKGRHLFGMRALKTIFEKMGNTALFKEVRKAKSGYSFEDVKGTYIMPTKVEACLQCALLEENLLSRKASFVFIVRDVAKKAVARCDPSLFTGNEKDGEQITFEFDLRKLLREYFLFLLPWPKEMNSKLRQNMSFIIKYFSVFSLHFATLY